MAKFNVIKNNFLKGEYSPKAFGRTDLEEYIQGAEQLENVFGSAEGGVFKRRGSIYKTNQRNYTTGGVVQGTTTISAWHRTFGFRTSDGLQQIIQLSVGDGVGGWGNLSLLELAGNNVYAPSATTSATFYQVLPPTGFLPQPWSYVDSTAKLKAVRSKQVGDIIYFVHQEMPMWWIKKQVDGRFAVGSYAATIPGYASNSWQRMPYLDVNPDAAITMTPSATTGSGITITVATPGDSTVFRFTKQNIVNRVFKFSDGVAVATDYSPGSSQITANVLDDFSGIGATASWQVSAWGGTGSTSLADYPSAIEYHEQRLYTGGTRLEPNKIYASQSGDITEFSIAIGGSTAADSSFGVALSSTEEETIRWMSSGQSLFVGTDRAEYRLYGPDPQESISATNVGAIKETNTGSSELSNSIKIDNSVYFVDASGIKVREYIFNENENAYRANNVMRFSDHMTDKSFVARSDTPADVLFNQPARINEVHYSNSEDLMFLLDNYHGLTCVAVDRESGLFCPSYVKIGGSLTDSDFPKIHSCCVMPQDGENVFGDELFIMVERTVNSASKFTIEKIHLGKYFQSSLEPAYTSYNSASTGHLPIYVDGAVIRNASGTATSLSGLSHLEGESVSVLADGLYIGEKTVASGAITLDTAAQVIIAGLAYNAKVKTLRIDEGSLIGSAQRAIKRIDEVALRFFKTVHAYVGKDDTNIYEVNFREPGANPGDPIALFTGDKIVRPKTTWDRDGQIYVKSSKPYPMHLCAVIMRGETSD
jgi:hypothetical protein